MFPLRIILNLIGSIVRKKNQDINTDLLIYKYLQILSLPLYEKWNLTFIFWEHDVICTFIDVCVNSSQITVIWICYGKVDGRGDVTHF